MSGNKRNELFDPELERLGWLSHRVWESAILFAAVELDLFTLLHDGPLSAEEIADKTGYDSKGVRIVMDALCPLQLIEKRAGRYHLTGTSARYLDSRSDHYAGPIFWGSTQRERWEAWSRVADAVREGKPVIERSRPPEDYYRGLVKMISFPAPHAASILADHLNLGSGGARGWSILDAACGAGRYGLTLLDKDPRARLTMIDLPAVLEIAVEEAGSRRLMDRIRTIKGNVYDVELPEAEFDLVLLSHFLHSETQQQCESLIKKLAKSQKEKGFLAIHEFVPDEQRCRRRFPLLFAMNMYIANGVGDTYTFTQIKTWMEAAGYGDVQMVDTPGRSSFVIGRLK